METPDEIEIPADPIDPSTVDQLEIQRAFTRSENLYANIDQGKVKVPPCTIEGEKIEIFELEPDGSYFFHAPRIATKIIELTSKGKKNITIDIPGITALVISNILNPDRFHFVAQTWKEVLSELLPKAIKKNSGISITCRTTAIIETQPYESIHGEITVIEKEVALA